MGGPFVKVGGVGASTVGANLAAHLFTARRHQLARPSDSLLSLQTVVRGQVHGFGRIGAVGGLHFRREHAKNFAPGAT